MLMGRSMLIKYCITVVGSLLSSTATKKILYKGKRIEEELFTSSVNCSSSLSEVCRNMIKENCSNYWKVFLFLIYSLLGWLNS